MGGGTGAMLTMMLREKVPELADVKAWAIACPACLTLDLARACAPAVTSLLHGTDVVPTFSIGTVDALREQVREGKRPGSVLFLFGTYVKGTVGQCKTFTIGTVDALPGQVREGRRGWCNFVAWDSCGAYLQHWDSGCSERTGEGEEEKWG